MTQKKLHKIDANIEFYKQTFYTIIVSCLKWCICCMRVSNAVQTQLIESYSGELTSN